MKHDLPEHRVDPNQVRDALLACGVSATDEQCWALARHAEMVREANLTMNLTRITEPEAMIRLHIADSLAFLPHVQMPRGSGVDVGSGAGYPGIPLAILGHDVALCESVKKKATFLERAVRELGLASSVWALRAEELALHAPAQADWVVFRAVSSLAALVELASPLLRQGGRVIVLKGLISQDEFSAGCAAAGVCGMSLVVRECYTLPGGEMRTVLVFSREGKSRTRLPRRPGMAQRRPLV